MESDDMNEAFKNAKRALAPHPAFDINNFADDLKEFDLEEEMREKILRDLWTILCLLVDLKTDVRTIHRLLPDFYEKGGKELLYELEQNMNQNEKEANDG